MARVYSRVAIGTATGTGYAMSPVPMTSIAES